MRHASGNCGNVRGATGRKKGIASFLLLALMTAGQSLAWDSDERILEVTQRSNDEDKAQKIETVRDKPPLEMNQLVKSAQERFDKGQYKEAELFYRKAMESAEAKLGTDDPNIANIANNLALVLRTEARYAEAEALYRRALETHQRVSGSQSPAVAAVLHNLGEVCRHQGRFVEAHALFNEALKIREARREQDDPEIAPLLNSMGALYFDQGQYAKGESLLKK